jgi:hypothetical protein
MPQLHGDGLNDTRRLHNGDAGNTGATGANGFGSSGIDALSAFDTK